MRVADAEPLNRRLASLAPGRCGPVLSFEGTFLTGRSGAVSLPSASLSNAVIAYSSPMEKYSQNRVQCAQHVQLHRAGCNLRRIPGTAGARRKVLQSRDSEGADLDGGRAARAFSKKEKTRARTPN
jgi:hypothetical protein